jgi:hypothetical protein
MTDDERPAEPADPADPEPTSVAAGEDGGPKDRQTPAPADPGDPDETVDKTDMSAVGDDGQVFGG